MGGKERLCYSVLFQILLLFALASQSYGFGYRVSYGGYGRGYGGGYGRGYGGGYGYGSRGGYGYGSVGISRGYGGYANAGRYVAVNPGAIHIAKRNAEPEREANMG